jgi:hypothetical protein
VGNGDRGAMGNGAQWGTEGAMGNGAQWGTEGAARQGNGPARRAWTDAPPDWFAHIESLVALIRMGRFMEG